SSTWRIRSISCFSCPSISLRSLPVRSERKDISCSLSIFIRLYHSVFGSKPNQVFGRHHHNPAIIILLLELFLMLKAEGSHTFDLYFIFAAQLFAYNGS